MTEQQIQQLIRNYNRRQYLVGVCTACGAIALWLVSFWIWRFFAFVWLRIFGVSDASSWSDGIATLLTLLLAIEGVRYKKRLFDLVDYHESMYYQDAGLLNNDSGSALNAYFGNPTGMAYLVSQALFSAPRASVVAIKCFRSTIRASDDSIIDAERIYRSLQERRNWVAAREFPGCGRALSILETLKLIWTQTERDGLQVRIPPLDLRDGRN